MYLIQQMLMDVIAQAEAKMRILSECGIHVVASPAKIGSKMAELISVYA